MPKFTYKVVQFTCHIYYILNKEINILKSSTDLSIKKFADEATEPVETKNKKSIFNVLAKWLPCVGNLIESSYYIIEIAKNFGIKIG